MNKNLIRYLCGFLAIVMLTSILPLTASAEIGTSLSGETTFETFEDLQKLASQTYDTYTSVWYAGREELIIKSSLTIPEKLSIDMGGTEELIVPAGVTLTAGNVWTSRITIDGTLNCTILEVNGDDRPGMPANSNLTVNGKLNARNIDVSYVTPITGMENITLTKEDGYVSQVRIYRHIWEFDQITEMAERAAAETDERVIYDFYLHPVYDSIDTLSINKTTHIPENSYFSTNMNIHIENGCSLIINTNFQPGSDMGKSCSVSGNGSLVVNGSLILDDAFTIEEGCTVELNPKYSNSIRNTLNINGTLVNNRSITVQYDDGGKLSFGNSGSYTGNGEIRIEGYGLADPALAVPGLDLSNFYVYKLFDENAAINGWLLTVEPLHSDDTTPTDPTPTDPPATEPPVTEPPATEPPVTEPPATEPPVVLPTITGTYTTDLVMSAADLGVSAPDSILRATMTFAEDGKATTTWEAIDLTAFRIFFHDMFVNSYYAMAYGAGITDINEIEAFCMESTGMSVSAYMDTIVTEEAMVASFTPASTSGTYTYNDDHSAIFTDMAFMGVSSDSAVENSFVIGDNTLYLNAASYGKADYTFICTRK